MVQTADTESTRRDTIKYGSALATGGALAGCSDLLGAGETGGTGRQADTYSVTIEPMGPVEFEGVPEDWVALLPSYADMGIALDAGQTLGIQLPERYASHFYDELPGVTYDPDDVLTLYQDGVDKELFYEMDADVHLMEPNQLIQWYDWNRDDAEEIESNIGPFFGNFIRRRSDEWHDYPYYSLYGAFEKVAAVFKKRDRFEALQSLHVEFIEDIQSRLPDERPEAALLYPAEEPPEKFYPYPLYDGGVGKKQWRDIGLRDALAGTDAGSYAGDTTLTVDYELLLDVDPDVLLVRGQETKTRDEFEDTLVSQLQDHTLASELTAVQNDDVYQGGYLDQGPLITLFQTEQAAKRVYSDVFPADEQLFDRQRVADIVNGEV